MSQYTAAEWQVTIRVPTDNGDIEELLNAFERKLGRSLAIIEDELRHDFGDIAVDASQ